MRFSCALASTIAALCFAGCARTSYQHMKASDGGSDSGRDTGVDTAPIISPSEVGSWATGVRISPRAHGDGFALLWSELGPQSSEIKLRFAVVDGDGALGAPVEVTTLPARSKNIDLLAVADGYIALYNTGQLFVLRLEADGTAVAEKQPIGPDDDIVTPSLFANPDGPVLLYSQRDPYQNRVMMRQLDPQGDAVGEPQKVDTSSNQPQTSARGIWTESGPLIVWRDNRRGSAQPRVRIASGPGDQSREVAEGSGPQTDARIAAGPDGQFLVTWVTDFTIKGVVVGASGDAVSTRAFGLAPANRRESIDYWLAGSDDGYMMVWQSDAETILPQIYHRLVDVRQGLLLPEPTLLQLSDGAEHCCPTVALTADRVGLAWIGLRDGAQRVIVQVRDER